MKQEKEHLTQKLPEFFSQEHKDKISQINLLWEKLHDLNELAKEYGIKDIFQDNGAKILQQVIFLNMMPLQGREGNDSYSKSGIEWEMKSINISTSASGFSTNHHINQAIIDKYRKVPWSFAVYRDLNLEEIWILTPDQLEIMYQKWEKKLQTGNTINNPKIPLSYVRENGVKVYPISTTSPIDPDKIALKAMNGY